MVIENNLKIFADCDKACNRCTGDGPDMCVRCAEGYKMQNKLCISMYYLSKNNPNPSFFQLYQPQT